MKLKYTVLLQIQFTAYCCCFKKPDVLYQAHVSLAAALVSQNGWCFLLDVAHPKELVSILKPVSFNGHNNFHLLSLLLHLRCRKQEKLMNLPVLIVNQHNISCSPEVQSLGYRTVYGKSLVLGTCSVENLLQSFH